MRYRHKKTGEIWERKTDGKGKDYFWNGKYGRAEWHVGIYLEPVTFLRETYEICKTIWFHWPLFVRATIVFGIVIGIFNLL